MSMSSAMAHEIIELQNLLSTAAPNIDHMQPLDTYEAVLAYTATMARDNGWDECDAVEIVCRAADLPPDDVRAAQAVLKRLGYTEVAERLLKIAGRRQRSLAPLV